jgi:hypothetical protein
VAIRRIDRIAPVLAEQQATKVSQLRGDVDLSQATVCGDFSGCELVEPVFSECRFEHAMFTEGIRGAGSLRKITITSDLVIPVAMALFGSLRITITDEN